MSWFDTAGIANLAKTALKEAQKTFDKALDLKEGEFGLSESQYNVDADNVNASNSLYDRQQSGITNDSDATKKYSLWSSFSTSMFEGDAEDDKLDTTVPIDDGDDVIAPLEPVKEVQLQTACGSMCADTDQNTAGNAPEELCDVSICDDGFSSSVLVVDAVSMESNLQSSPTGGVSREVKPSVESRTGPVSLMLATEPHMDIADPVEMLDDESGSGDISLLRNPSYSRCDRAVSIARSAESPDSLTSSNSSCHTLISSESSAVSQLKTVADSGGSEPGALLNVEVDSSLDTRCDNLSETTESSTETLAEAVVQPTDADALSEQSASLSRIHPGDTVSELSSHCVTDIGSCSGDHTEVENPAEGTPDSIMTSSVEIIESCSSSPDVPVKSIVPDLSCLSELSHGVSRRAHDALLPTLCETDCELPSDYDNKEESVVLPGAYSCDSTESDSVSLSVAPSDYEGNPAQAVDDVQTTAEGSSACDTTDKLADNGSKSPGSEQQMLSSHTSADGTETAASSDVEILMSPHGDLRVCSSRLQSRPARFDRSGTPSSDASHATPASGHSRNLSQTSVASSEGDADRQLARRLLQMDEILAAREAKLMDLSQRNASLQEDNSNLNSRVDHLETQVSTGSSVEKQIHHVTTERDRYRSQLQEKVRLCTKDHLTRTHFNEVVLEKETIIDELRAEGEKLSKEQFKHNTIIKKLRSKDQEREALVKKQEEKLASMTTEMNALKEQLASLSDNDRERGKAHAQFSRQVERLEREAVDAKAECKEAKEKLAGLEHSLQSSKKEVAELNKQLALRDSEVASQVLSTEIEAKERLRLALDEYKLTMSREQEELMGQLEDLRRSMHRTEREHARREDSLKADCTSLEARLSAAEWRNDELSDSAAAATQPLLRQLQELQASSSQQRANWERAEQLSAARLAELQRHADELEERERRAAEQCCQARAAQTAAEQRISDVSQQTAALTERCSRAESRLAQLQGAAMATASERKSAEAALLDQLTELKRDNESVERQLEVERVMLLAEKARSCSLLQQVQELSRAAPLDSSAASQLSSPRTSPTPSLSQISFNSSVCEPLACSGALTPRLSAGGSWLGAAGTLPGTALFESLTAQLKQRDGELHQLRSERASLEQERRQLSTELARLTGQLQLVSGDRRRLQQLSEQHRQLEGTYNALLQMYGEKAEENEELRLDLADVKEMYRQQIDHLTQRVKS